MRDSDRQENPPQLPEGSGSSRSGPASGSRKVLYLVFFIVLAGLVGLAVYASRWKKEVAVREFVVEGASSGSSREISTLLRGYKGRNMQSLDAGELKKRIGVIPYVREAFISKELNGIVRIKVVERMPVALTMLYGRVMAIDGDGMLLPGKREFTERAPKLLEVSGFGRLRVAGNGMQQLEKRDTAVLLQFLDALASTDYASLLIREFHFADNNQSYCVAVQAPARFIVGNDGNFKEKLKKFEIFWQKVVSKKGFGAFDTVDLRFRDRIFTRDPASSEAPQDSSL